MNWENIRIRYIEIGIPLFMFGTLIMAVGFIIDYLTVVIYDTSHITVRLIVVAGIMMMCVSVMAFPLLFKSEKE